MLNALKTNRKAFARKENPIPAETNQTVTKIEQNIRKQALKRAAAPLFWHGRLYLFQRLIFICGNGVFLSSERFLSFKAFSIQFVYTCSLNVPLMFRCQPTPPHPSNIRPLSDHRRPQTTAIRPHTTTIRPPFQGYMK